MGITYIEGRVRGPTGKEVEARFLVDSGATYTVLPEKGWREIELEETLGNRPVRNCILHVGR